MQMTSNRADARTFDSNTTQSR